MTNHANKGLQTIAAKARLSLNPNVQLESINMKSQPYFHALTAHRINVPRSLCIFLLAAYSSVMGETLSVKAIYQQSKDSVVLLSTYDENSVPLSIGSGFAILDGDIIATSLHVVSGSKLLKIKYSDGVVCEAISVLGYDPDRDIALIKSPKTVRPLLISTNKPDIGDSVVVIGNPKGLENTLSEGIVSGIRKDLNSLVVQITAPISPGSSGGPVLIDDGSVLGIATSCMVEGQNLNFAVPAKYISLISTTNSRQFSRLSLNPEKSKYSAPDTTQVQISSSRVDGKTIKASVFNNNTFPIQNIKILVVFHSLMAQTMREYSEAGKVKAWPPGTFPPIKPVHYEIFTVDAVVLPKLAKRFEKYIPVLEDLWNASYRVLDYDILNSSDLGL